MNPPDRVITTRILLVLCGGIGVAGKKRTPTTSIELATESFLTSDQMISHLPALMAMYDSVVVMADTWEKAQQFRERLTSLGYHASIASTYGQAMCTFQAVEKIAAEAVQSAPTRAREIWTGTQAVA